MGDRERVALAVGQVWRVRKTGTLRRITRLQNATSEHAPYYDVGWETVAKPVRRGATWEEFWLRNCVIVEAGEADE